MKKAKNNSYIGTHDYKHKNNYLRHKFKKKGGHNE